MHPCTPTVYVTPAVVLDKIFIVRWPDPLYPVLPPERPGRDQRVLITSWLTAFTSAMSALLVEINNLVMHGRSKAQPCASAFVVITIRITIEKPRTGRFFMS